MSNGANAAMKQIWPLNFQNITWPPVIGLDIGTATTTAGSFYNFSSAAEALSTG